jgi:isoleucyl-tRNA synthetase
LALQDTPSDRATTQWIIRITDLKDALIRDAEATLWIPVWAGANQFKNWLQGLKDWVVSRQRFWGTPLPVWVCSSCGKERIIGSKQELLENATATPNLPTLHVPWVDAVKLRCECGGEMARVPDVMDVWFESGSAHLACLGHPKDQRDSKFWWPADFIVEGRDQITAWFFALLRNGMVTMGKSPYKTVLMHGFALDAEGREMHKSLGNFVTANEVAEKFGRDVFRYYVLQATLWEDLKFSWDAIKQYSGDLTTFWNTFVFASTYMSLDEFSPSQWPTRKLARSLRAEDRWLLSRMHRTIKETTQLMDEYKVHETVRKLKTFLVEDLSHTYVRFIRRRTWVEKETMDKLAAYSTLYTALKEALIMLTPIVPFFTESVYQHMFRNAEPKHPQTVHLLDWPKLDEKWINDSLEVEMDAARGLLSAVAVARMEKTLKQRQPVPLIVVASDSKSVRTALKSYQTLLLEQANTRTLTSTTKGATSKFEAGTRFAKANFDGGSVYLDLKLSRSEVAEGLARDAVRRMQQMRKEMDLKVDSYVHAYIAAPTRKAVSLLQSKKKYIAGEVRVKKLTITTKKAQVNAPYYTKTWSINQETYEFGLCEITKLRAKAAS